MTVPLDGLSNPLLPFPLSCPSQCLELRVIDSVSLVVDAAVGDIVDELMCLTRRTQAHLHDQKLGKFAHRNLKRWPYGVRVTVSIKA